MVVCTMPTSKVLQALWGVCVVVLTCTCGRSQALGEQYVGIGYNVLTANPDGGLASRGGVDPGLLITRRVLKVTDSRAIQTQLRHSCGSEQTTSTFYGGKSYQDKLAVGVNLEGSVIAGLVNVMFSLSPRFLRTQNETNVDHKVFQDEELVCNLGHVRFVDELSDWLNVTVTDSFASSVCHLPETYSQGAYMAFLDHWGTHITREVDIGTKVIHRSQTSLAEFVRHVMKASGADVSLGGFYMGFAASLGIDIDKFQSSDSFNQSFGSHHETLQVGSEAMPEPIKVDLVSIDTALQSKFWDVGDSFTSRGLCDVNTKIDVIAANLRQALTEYAAFKMARPPTDPPLVVPLTWPRGTYGLPRPVSGCPGGRVTWYEGFRYFDNGYVFGKNVINSNLHLSGSWPVKDDIQMEFCMKGDRVLSEFDVDWPAGDYCLFKYGTCPTGFQQGFVQWDDGNVKNHDRLGGTVPDGVYDTNTKIEFCCRNDGLPTHPLYLPIDRPFYLFRHVRGCQHVHNMTMHEEVVQWDEAFNWFFFGYKDAERIGGSHPFDDGDGDNHRLHFCFYSPSGQSSGSDDLIG
ncbi:uncharacterized protein LOC143277529 [Babylonia areolata]|uniref:uncharacterized protein LOC143277529 n=1 Tax=Babylonia areolata TaxID=304850 RepID=UPI003FD068F6